MIRSKTRGSTGDEVDKLEEALKEIKRLSEEVEKMKIEHRQKVRLTSAVYTVSSFLRATFDLNC